MTLGAANGLPGGSAPASLTLRFSDPGLEAGFAKHRVPLLISSMRKCSLCLALLILVILIVEQPWDRRPERYGSLLERDVRERCHLAVTCFFFLAFFAFCTWSCPCMNRLSARALEIVGVCMITIGLAAHTFAIPWYMARVLGYDAEEVIEGATDANLLLAIDCVVTAAHLLLPIRFFAIVAIDLAGVLAYIVPVFALEGPEMHNAPIHTCFLVCLICLASLGRHAVEYHERCSYVLVITEKRLRFESEFALSAMSAGQEESTPGRPPSISGASFPSTSATESAFKIGNDTTASLQQLAEIGEKEQWLVPMEDVAIPSGPLLGEGGFGRVDTGLYLGVEVALKFPKESLRRSHVVSICNELRILRRLRHPNIVSFHGACVDISKSTLGLILDRVKGSTLGQFIRSRLGDSRSGDVSLQGRPNDAVRVTLLVDISSALSYVHSRTPRVVHGDLKTQNIFVVKEGSSAPVRAKLLDFGLARALTKHANPLGGTLRWAAPEVIRGRAAPSTAADVFSFGRLIFFVATSLYPFGRTEDMELIKNGAQPQSELAMLVGNGLAGKCRCLVEQCCQLQVAPRPPMRQVHSEVMSWREVWPDSRHHSRKVDPHAIQEPGVPMLATSSHRGRGNASRSLAASSFAPTPNETVMAMITELLVSCNVTIDAEACCFYHGALVSLRHHCNELRERPCWNRTPADIQNTQCQQCGVLALVETPPSGDSSSRCFFCDGPYYQGAGNQAASEVSI